MQGLRITRKHIHMHNQSGLKTYLDKVTETTVVQTFVSTTATYLFYNNVIIALEDENV